MASWNRSAKPRGPALAELSGMFGRPVAVRHHVSFQRTRERRRDHSQFENRAMIGVDDWLKCGATDSSFASGLGVKVP